MTTVPEDQFILDGALLDKIPALAEVGAEPYRVRTTAPDTASQNVQNVYKGWTTEQLRHDLDTRRNKSIHVFYNTGSDYNIATAIRSGAAFAVGGLLICERHRYDRRGTVGTHLLQHVAYVESTLEAIAALKKDGYTVYAVDYIEGKNPVSLYEVEFPEKSAFVYGMEGDGLPDEIIDACDEMTWIPMPGGILRSLNLSVSASLMMAEYCRQWPNSRLFE